MENIKIPKEFEENKDFLAEFNKLEEKAQFLYLKLWLMNKTTDLTDENGEKYVVYKFKEANKSFGGRGAELFKSLENNGFIKRRKRIKQPAMIFLPDISGLFTSPDNQEQSEKPKSNSGNSFENPKNDDLEYLEYLEDCADFVESLYDSIESDVCLWCGKPKRKKKVKNNHIILGIAAAFLFAVGGASLIKRKRN